MYVCNDVGADSSMRTPMGEDRATYRREGGPGGADKRGEAGAGATQSFQFVRNSCNVNCTQPKGLIYSWLSNVFRLLV